MGLVKTRHFLETPTMLSERADTDAFKAYVSLLIELMNGRSEISILCIMPVLHLAKAYLRGCVLHPLKCV